MWKIKPLREFPALAAWYELTRANQHINLNSSKWLGIETCKIMDRSPTTEALEKWIRCLDHFFQNSKDLREDYLGITTLFHDHLADFNEIIGDISHLILSENLGSQLLRTLKIGAEKSNLAVIRFLAAWVALNCDEPSVCIQECDLVDEPFAPIFTLQGQALLEIGRPKEALHALDVATNLAPHEIMGWFQKAKVLFALKRDADAFEVLQICERLAPGNLEVAVFMGIVAHGLKNKNKLLEHAWRSLKPHFSANIATFQIPYHLLRLAILMGDRDKAMEIIDTPAWIITLDSRSDLSNFGNILREFQNCGWMDLAANLIDKCAISQSVHASL